MTRLLLPILLCVAALSLSATATEPKDEPPQKTHRMSLRQLWQVASQRFPGMQAAGHAVAAAKFQLDEQKWLYLPSGEVTTFLTGSPSVKCQEGKYLLLNTGPNACLSTTAVDLTHGPIEDILPVHGVVFRLDLRILQPIYTFGKLEAARDLGRVGVDMARAQADSSRADLALNVLRAYYGVKTARAALDTVRDGKEQITGWIKRIDKELEKGKSSYSELDLLRLKVADSQVDITLADLERTAKSALAALHYLAQDALADIDDSELLVQDNEAHDLSYYLDAAFAHRPELRQLNALGVGAKAYRRLRIAEFLPDLGVVGSLSYGLATGVEDPNNAFLNRSNYLGASLGLAMRMNLDYGPKVARLRKAGADLLQYEARRRELLGGGALEVERTFNDLVEANKRLRAAEVAERRARGLLQGVRQAIDVGTAESRELIDALRTYFELHGLVLRTINDVNVMAGTLRRQSGLPVIPE